MIVVTGANGQLGREVVGHLLTRVPADQIGVSVRDPTQAQHFAQRGVRVRHGDFDDAASLSQAFEGASRVLVVSASALGETAIRLNTTAIQAAKAAGAERIFYTSHVGANPDSPFPPMPTHAAIEAALGVLDVPFTVLRNGFYAEYAPSLLGDALQTGELRAPEDGAISFTTHADLAEATAVALTDDGLDDEILALTAAEAVDLAGIAAITSKLTGRPIRRVVVSDDEHRASLAAQGLPDIRIDMSLRLLQASRLGQFARVEETLARLVGRPPTLLEDVLGVRPAGLIRAAPPRLRDQRRRQGNRLSSRSPDLVRCPRSRGCGRRRR